MKIINGLVLTEKWAFEPKQINIKGDQILSLTSASADNNDRVGTMEKSEVERITRQGIEEDPIFDASNLYVLPGLVDLHIHGCAGFDFCDGTPEAMHAMAVYLSKRGITSFLPTSMALPAEELEQVFSMAAAMMDERKPDESRMLGIHMEGPFFNRQKKGAQSEKHVIAPDYSMFEHLYNMSGEQIKLLDLAPELDGAMDMIRRASKLVTVSIGHTTADYDTARKAIQFGANHITHLFNAMPGLHHRNPGVVGAVMDTHVTAELICDGYHLHPAIIRMIFKTLGSDRVVLVSDAMRACGLPEGDYDLGGQLVYLRQGKATLADGTLAGSATDLLQCVKNAVHFGLPLEDAVKAASFNPASVIGADADVGSLAPGKKADLILLDHQLTLRAVVLGGRLIIEDKGAPYAE